MVEDHQVVAGALPAMMRMKTIMEAVAVVAVPVVAAVVEEAVLPAEVLQLCHVKKFAE
jgi:hypothetical protein